MQPTFDRDPRVRFKHPVRVVPIGGPPRAYRVLATNISHDGMFLRMTSPFDTGTKVALSLEAGGRILPFAQGEVVWRDLEESKPPGRGAGFAVRFTGFLHPRANELVAYLVANLETGKPLRVPEPARARRRRKVWMLAGLAVLVVGAVVATALSPGPTVAEPTHSDGMNEVRTAIVEPKIEPRPVAAKREAPASEPAAAVKAIAPDSVEAFKPVEKVKPEVQTLAIPSGGVRMINATVEGNQLALTLTLAQGGLITKAFTLGRPDRLAIDVRGTAPKKSHTVSGTGVIQKVRVGKVGRGTRIVIDLRDTPGKPVVKSGTTVLVSLRQAR